MNTTLSERIGDTDPDATPRTKAADASGAPASAEVAVALDGVHLELESGAGPVKILKGISLSVPAGQVVSVVGPSGSGKSSMMMIVAGLERPTSGSVVVAGNDLNRMSEDQLALFRRDAVGIVFQNFHLIPTMTALENVAIPLEFAGRPDAFDRAAEALKAVGLGHRLTHYPGQLSGGEQQRTALARAFASDPPIVLADEPTGNLDSDTGAQVIDLMFTLSRKRGSTLLLITHDPALAERCDRTVRLENGHIVSAQSPARAAMGAMSAGLAGADASA